MATRVSESPPIREPRPPRIRGRRDDRGDRGHQRGPRARTGLSRAGRYLLLGGICLTPALLLYFWGGFLFVAAYNGEYPFMKSTVGAFESRIFYYIGPILFFIGLITFILSYAMICKGIDNMGRR